MHREFPATISFRVREGEKVGFADHCERLGRLQPDVLRAFVRECIESERLPTGTRWRVKWVNKDDHHRHGLLKKFYSFDAAVEICELRNKHPDTCHDHHFPVPVGGDRP